MYIILKIGQIVKTFFKEMLN